MISFTISLLSWQCLSFWSLSTLGTNLAQIFRIFSSSRVIVCTVLTLTSNCALIVSIDTRRSLSTKFFIWPINSGVLTSLLLPHLSLSLTDSLSFWISYATPKLMLDSCKMVEKQPEAFHTFLWHFFPSLKQNFIAYRSSKVSWRPDCIFEIHQLWQSGFSRVYSNCCCSCLFEVEIIKIGQSSHKMYSNNIVNFQKSTSILKSWNQLKAPRIYGTKIYLQKHFKQVNPSYCNISIDQNNFEHLLIH